MHVKHITAVSFLFKICTPISSLHINKSPLSNCNCFLTCGLLPTLCNIIYYLYNKIKLFRSLLALMKRNRFVGHMEKAKAYFLNNVILLLSHFSLFSICKSCQRQHSTFDSTYIEDYLAVFRQHRHRSGAQHLPLQRERCMFSIIQKPLSL